MQLIAELVATLMAGLWTGAAIYIAFAEHPSALKVGVGFATDYFKHMSKRTAPLMMVFSALSGLSAIYVWFAIDNYYWLIGGLIQLGMFPLTAVLIVPTNIRLIKIDPQENPAEAAALHSRWARMHNLRTVIGGTAFPIFIWLIAGSAGI